MYDQSCLWLTLPDSHLQCITNQFCFHSCTHTPANHCQVTQWSQDRKPGDNNCRRGTGETCSYSGLKGRDTMVKSSFFIGTCCVRYPHKVAVNKRLPSHMHIKATMITRTKKRFFCLCNFLFFCFGEAYSPERNLYSSMKTVVFPIFLHIPS